MFLPSSPASYASLSARARRAPPPPSQRRLLQVLDHGLGGRFFRKHLPPHLVASARLVRRSRPGSVDLEILEQELVQHGLFEPPGERARAQRATARPPLPPGEGMGGRGRGGKPAPPLRFSNISPTRSRATCRRCWCTRRSCGRRRA